MKTCKVFSVGREQEHSVSETRRKVGKELMV